MNDSTEFSKATAQAEGAGTAGAPACTAGAAFACAAEDASNADARTACTASKPELCTTHARTVRLGVGPLASRNLGIGYEPGESGSWAAALDRHRLAHAGSHMDVFHTPFDGF